MSSHSILHTLAWLLLINLLTSSEFSLKNHVIMIVINDQRKNLVRDFPNLLVISEFRDMSYWSLGRGTPLFIVDDHKLNNLPFYRILGWVTYPRGKLQ